MKTVAITNKNGEITVGKVNFAEVGDIVTVSLHDENGIKIDVVGEVVEILEEN